MAGEFIITAQDQRRIHAWTSKKYLSAAGCNGRGIEELLHLIPIPKPAAVAAMESATPDPMNAPVWFDAQYAEEYPNLIEADEDLPRARPSTL